MRACGSRVEFAIQLRTDDGDWSELLLPRRRFLRVDDDSQLLRYVRNTLSEAGYAPIVIAVGSAPLMPVAGE